MAGYKKSGSKDFVNATTFNKQIDRQRQAYQDRSQNAMGVAKDYIIFPDNREEILNSSFEILEALDLEYVPGIGGGNPDFEQKFRLDYEDTTKMFNNIDEPVDLPNMKGPNLIIPPDLDNLTAPTVESAGSEFENRGYGWKDPRNEPASESSTLGSYFKTHYSLNTSNNPPTFGEANDQGDDVIDYKKP